MIVFFVSLYSLSKIFIFINSYILCGFNYDSKENMRSVKTNLLKFLYFWLLMTFAQNALTSMCCLFFAENKISAFKLFGIFPFVTQAVLFFILNIFKSRSKIDYHSILIKIINGHKYIYLLLSFLVIHICAVWLLNNRLLNESVSALQTVLIIIIILMIINISVIVSGCYARYTFLHRSSSFRKQYKIQLEHYREIETLNSELKSFQHDFSNHIHCIHALMDSGEILKAKEYIERLDGFKTMSRNFFTTGNPICDAILTDKQSYAKSLGASIRANCRISTSIDSVDLCTLLSNALDNSIEACVKSNINKEIRVLAYTHHDFQYIKITNPSNLSNIDFETTKKDKSLHGIGIANIKRIVKKYDGTFSAKTECGLFTLKIILKIDKILSPPPDEISDFRVVL